MTLGLCLRHISPRNRPKGMRSLIFVALFAFAQLVSFRNYYRRRGPPMQEQGWLTDALLRQGFEQSPHPYDDEKDKDLSQYHLTELKQYYAKKARQCAAAKRTRERKLLQCGEALLQQRSLPMSDHIVNSSALPPHPSATNFQFAYQYSQPTTRRSWTLPDPSRRYRNETMIVLILSERNNTARRKTIRETWGKSHPIYFVIGGDKLETDSKLVRSKSDLQESLEDEQTTHGDLLDTIHPESYYSLTHKVRYAYRWIINNNPYVEWLVKADDDLYLRVGTLQKAFLSYFNPYTPLVIGRILQNRDVLREGKWAESLYMNKTYPIYPNGMSAYVVSRVVAEYVAFTPGLFYYQSEDVSLGIWMDESSLYPTFLHSEYFALTGRCKPRPYNWFTNGHRFPDELVRACYVRLDEWPEESLRDLNGKRFYGISNIVQREDTVQQAVKRALEDERNKHALAASASN